MVTKRIKALAAILALFTMPLAQAQQEQNDKPSSYDFAFGSLALTELDSLGLEIGGSFSLARQVYLFGSYQDWEVGEVVDRSILRIGGGYYWDISENLDLDVGAALADSELDRPGFNDLDDDGLILHAGLRGWASPVVELSSFIFLDDSLGSDSETVLELGGQYFTRNDFSFGGRVRIDEDDTTLFFGVRFYFNR
jgi:hypothetical protein